MSTAYAEQLPAAGHIPGNKGMWAGILCEMTEFAVLFTVYFTARVFFPQEFRAGPSDLNLYAGTLNTLLMISGSYFVVNAVIAIRENRAGLSVRWLVLVLLAAAGYMLTKYLEFGWNTAHGVTAGNGAFYTVYYYLTLTHMVHVGWGMIGLLWIIVRTRSGAYTPAEHEAMESFASYWHATDLVWLIIFPLLYLLR
ncbi:MAG: cytochrome C oxidase subunit III [Gammaproteobacteria bacterium HGW-Gammaproteobacteria-1]|jgi:cytochrome c oxidase subunit 3|nr:MAG: cytochrome C oxidase subunit III [Gammaproteobacteria bacterium HGW-Gammaproteobacteria-1]